MRFQLTKFRVVVIARIVPSSVRHRPSFGAQLAPLGLSVKTPWQCLRGAVQGPAEAPGRVAATPARGGGTLLGAWQRSSVSSAEFEPDGAVKVIEGKVGEKFGQSYLERMNNEQFAGRRWKAVLSRKIVERKGRKPSETYTLLELDEVDKRPAEK